VTGPVTDEDLQVPRLTVAGEPGNLEANSKRERYVPKAKSQETRNPYPGALDFDGLIEGADSLIND